jgi:hypothetical protein
MNRIATAAVLLALATPACASFGSNTKTQKKEPEEGSEIIQVDVTVSGLNDEDAKTLESEISQIDGVKNLRVDPLGGNLVYVFDYGGDFERLRRRLEAIEYPGLRREKVIAQLNYEGYDNRAPKIDVISPNTDEVITETEIEFVVEVEDNDVDQVTVNGTKARERKPTIYHATVEVPEGEQEVEIVAIDEAENESKQTVSLTVDTTPPEVEATVKVVVEGKVEPGSTVYVDGKEAEVNMFGNWRIELAVEKGQKSVEVVAIDEAGNKKTEQKSIGL